MAARITLGVSKQTCVPGSSLASARPAGELSAAQCQACGAPGGSHGELLESHVIGKGRRVRLCPICHSCFHLDHAGKTGAGHIIWLPEIGQAQLNTVALAVFVAKKQAEDAHAPKEVVDISQQAMRVYAALKERCAIVDAMFTAQKSPAPKTSNPSTFADLIIVARQRLPKMDNQTFAQKIEGLRLLPSIHAHEGYVTAVTALTKQTMPVQSWPQLAKASKSQRLDGDDVHEHFDASVQA